VLCTTSASRLYRYLRHD
jgi:hypothetical protein